MEIAIYSRKSVYTSKGESIDNQIEMCKQYVLQKFNPDKDIILTIYEDEGFSGKSVDRPQFQKMLKEIKNHRFAYVVCYRLDRISRSVSDFSALIEDLYRYHVTFLCVKEEFDTSKPMGKAMMYIASVFAQLERETIAERVRDNMLMLARKGHWLGGTTPTGYTSQKVQEMLIDGKEKAFYKLKQNLKEIDTVKTIYQQFKECGSLSGVSKFLIREQIKSRNGKFYSLLGIKKILQNPVYCIADRQAFDFFTAHHADVCFTLQDCSDERGLLSYNKRDYKIKNAPRLSMEHWIIAIGNHKGIITGSEWSQVQNMLNTERQNKSAQVHTHNQYSLLSGMIYCKKCGQKMFAKARYNQKERFDYICNGKLHGGVSLCNCENINGKNVDKIIWNLILNQTKMNLDLIKYIKKLKKEVLDEETQPPLYTLSMQLEKCNSEMNTLIQSLAENKFGQISQKKIQNKILDLESELKQLTERRKTLQNDAAKPQSTQQINHLASLLSNFNSVFQHATLFEKRVLIQSNIQQIVWDGKNLHVYY